MKKEKETITRLEKNFNNELMVVLLIVIILISAMIYFFASLDAKLHELRQGVCKDLGYDSYFRADQDEYCGLNGTAREIQTYCYASLRSCSGVFK